MSSEKKELQNEETGIPVNVLIIAHKQSQFASAASFLSRRGIPCTVKSNIRDGLQFITKSKATHVFLSWNLPGANIIKTYQLITKTFKVECVVYAEKSDGKTAAELTMSRLPEVMQAPVSGPGLYMRIQKLIKQKEEGPAESAQDKKNTQQQKNKTTRIKCSNKDVPADGTWENAGVDPEDGQPIYRFKSTAKNSDPKTSYTFKGPKPPEKGADGTWNGGEGLFQMESEEHQKKSNFVNFQKKGAQYSEHDYQKEDDKSDESGNDISDLLNGVDLDELEATSIDPNSSDEMSTTDQSESGKELSSDLTDESDTHDHMAEDETSESQSFSSSGKKKRQEKSYGSVMNVAKKNHKKDSDLPEYQKTSPKEALIIQVDPTIKSNGPISLLAEKVLEAIKNSTKPSSAIESRVGIVSEARAFTIHSPRFHGFLLLTSSNKILMNEETFQSIKEHMMILLDKVGERLLNLEELNLDLKNLEFQVWADEHAEFIISSSHEGNEIICAFIPSPSTLPHIKENEDPSMISVGAKDLEAQTKTKFNLFLHLPKNNKFIRYLKPGDDIQIEHLKKFEEHKLDDLHIKKEDLKCFKEYFVSNKLNNLSSQSKKKAS